MKSAVETRQVPPDRHARIHASLNLWLVNVLLGVLVCTAYLRHLPDELSPRAWVFVVFGLVSSVATLALVPAAISWLALRFMRSTNQQALIEGFVGAVFLSVMKVDTVVYSLLRYHFLSSAVFNVAITEGSGDAVHLGGRVWLPVVVVITLLTTGQFLLWRHFYRRRRDSHSPREFTGLLSRPTVAWALVLLMIVGVEKSIFAAADMEGDREVSNISDVLPAYSPLRVSNFFPDDLGPDSVPFGDIRIQDKGAPLAYPLEMPELEPGSQRLNVLMLVIDSWRQDALNERSTPQMHALSRNALNFENHAAGGNGTRFGIFTMLYGIHGSYWFSALEENRSPVLLDVLQEDGYDLQVFSSASMNFPEFRDCAWSRCLDQVHDDYPAEEPYERDLLAAEGFKSFLDGRSAAREAGEQNAPFFNFVLLDAAHQPYSYPGEGPFQPCTEGIDYVELSHNRSPEMVERLYNRYRNALHFADTVAADLIEALRSSGELENTIVMITGDHGEEFQESSFWGHTSNFTPEQIAVPLLLMGAGIEAGVELRPTSHLDLAPTILEMMGADPTTRADWCLGQNLFDPRAERDIVVSGWEHVGVILPEMILRMRMGGSTANDVSVYDRHWQPQNDALRVIKENKAALQKLSDECARFLATDPG